MTSVSNKTLRTLSPQTRHKKDRLQSRETIHDVLGKRWWRLLMLGPEAKLSPNANPRPKFVSITCPAQG